LLLVGQSSTNCQLGTVTHSSQLPPDLCINLWKAWSCIILVFGTIISFCYKFVFWYVSTPDIGSVCALQTRAEICATSGIRMSFSHHRLWVAKEYDALGLRNEGISDRHCISIW